MKSGLEIAQEAELRPITEIAASAGIPDDVLEPFGRYRAKVDLSILDRLADRPDGKLIITTAITPTKAGEGKTTTSISLTQGMGKIGKDVLLCLREPSMGPVFGIKGGGTGGGYAQVVPMEDINLHFNGDFHAVTAAHNLLASALDASLYFGNPLGIDQPQHHLAADARRQRARAPVHGHRPRRQDARRPARERVRDHRRVRGDGRAGARVRSRRPPRPPGTDRRRVDDGRGAGHGRAAAGRGGDGRDHEGRAEAQPRADARGAARADPRGAVRERRPREQLDHRGPRGAQARRLRHHRGGVRERPRVPEVLRHRVPVRGVRALGRRAGDDRAGDEVARRRAVRSSSGPRTWRRSSAASRTSASTSRSSASTACRASSRSTTSRATRRPRSS